MTLVMTDALYVQRFGTFMQFDAVRRDEHQIAAQLFQRHADLLGITLNATDVLGEKP